MVASSRPSTTCTRSRSPTDGSSPRRATRSSSPFSARRRSRFRRYRSSARVPTSATERSRSRARRTWRCRSSSTSCGRSSPPPRRPRTSSRPARRRRRSSTTAPASTRASSPSAGRVGSSRAATASAGIRCSEELLVEIAETAGVPPADVPVAVDGCGVPTFAFTLERSARLFGELPRMDGRRPRRRRHAHLSGAAARPRRGRCQAHSHASGLGREGRGGGLLCACSEDGLAVVLKVEDGSFRAILPALASFLESLGDRARASSASSPWRTATENVSGR